MSRAAYADIPLSVAGCMEAECNISSHAPSSTCSNASQSPCRFANVVGSLFLHVSHCPLPLDMTRILQKRRHFSFPDASTRARLDDSNSSFFSLVFRLKSWQCVIGRGSYSLMLRNLLAQTIHFDNIKMFHKTKQSPVLLLKTKSTPVDSYEEYFSQEPFTPIFVPVLEHKPNEQNLDFVRSLLLGGKLGRNYDANYGGMIFTSQRAVEGFATMVEQVERNHSINLIEAELMHSLFSMHTHLLLCECAAD